MKVTILGKSYELVEVGSGVMPEGHYGECDDPSLPGKQIRVREGLPEEDRLRIYLHEMLHAAAWEQFSEEFVDRLSTDMARVLWRAGWRATA